MARTTNPRVADPRMKAQGIPPKTKNIPWFVGADANNKPAGFTSLPDQAMVDREGIPVLCPGDMNRVWNAEFARRKLKKDRIWGYLLDRMETELELADAQEAAAEAGDVMRQRSIKRDRSSNRGAMHGLKLALAELELPQDRASTIDEDIAWVEKRAQDKYDMEAE